ncbi:hypothetical protein JG688_00010326 [Phytophthora aleatoria]|uniref:Uncharacterized protein n=1 Tax=Phytophthora aleatoria TaxID=2496075 RepID=A0A8J5IQG2_9STRA|nr:hypothetical protein JG688_00010326 [Phytophthora aleatoria]
MPFVPTIANSLADVPAWLIAPHQHPYTTTSFSCLYHAEIFVPRGSSFFEVGRAIVADPAWRRPSSFRTGKPCSATASGYSTSFCGCYGCWRWWRWLIGFC